MRFGRSTPRQTEENSRGLMAEIRSALGLAEPLCGGDRYFRKGHCGQDRTLPLPASLCAGLPLNIFNPRGRFGYSGGPDPLQQKREHADLRYDIPTLPDPDSPVLGEAPESMVRPGAPVNEAAGRVCDFDRQPSVLEAQLGQARAG